MTVCVDGLNFSLVTKNDDITQMNVNKRSDGLPARIQSAKWEMFPPGGKAGVTPALITKQGSDIIIVDRTVNGVLYPSSAFKFLIEQDDTANLPQGYYPHEGTITAQDGRVHTVTMGDAMLQNGQIFIRVIYTPPPT